MLLQNYFRKVGEIRRHHMYMEIEKKKKKKDKVNKTINRNNVSEKAGVA